MICRTCIRRASALRSRIAVIQRPFSVAIPRRDAAAAAPPEPLSATPPTSSPLIDPYAAADAEPAKPVLSSCPKGTVLNGLNFFKGKEDPVALADEDYPAWLWRCLDDTRKVDAEAEDEGDEFSKSKKQRRVAAKKKRQLEEKLMAAGNLEALAPKIPLQQQTINLPGAEGGSAEDAVLAEAKRRELRQALRRERKAKIKENNFLGSM